jgi:hypothetical protein
MAFLTLVDAPLSSESMKFPVFGRKWDQTKIYLPKRSEMADFGG